MKLNSSTIEKSPGVYLFKDKEGKVLYVGKAVNLRERVKSHFQNASIDSRTKLLIESSFKLDTIRVESEIEALILEANLIKKFHPYFNIRLKDDKDYLYIKITKEDFPKVVTARKRDLENAKKYFGPYPTSKVVRSTLRNLRKSFPFCSTPPKNGKINELSHSRADRVSQGMSSSVIDSSSLQADEVFSIKNEKPCFYYHLNLCTGVCIGKIDKKEYRKIINRLSTFLSGKKEAVIKDLKKEMNAASLSMDYEKASKIRDYILGIEYLTSNSRDVSLYETNPDFLKERRIRELRKLKEVLNLKKLPVRIECYDISNFFGANPTGSMVVLSVGESDKSQYRRFKIKSVKGINDYAMMEEVLKRRFKNNWEEPDLLVVDGGKGQLKIAEKVLSHLEKNIPLISLAKREEEIFVVGYNSSIKLPRDSEALQVIQRIRDEAHRFALSYHRKLRSKEFISR